MGLESSSSSSETWGDMYALFRMLRDDPNLSLNTFYFHRLDGDNFERPSALIKFLSVRNSPENHRTRRVEISVFIKYFASDVWDASATAEKIGEIFSGWPQTYIPKWDFTVSPPNQIPLTGHVHGAYLDYTLPIRVLPESVVVEEPMEVPGDYWEVPIFFTISSPRIRTVTSAPIITAINHETLVNPPEDPVEVTASVIATPSVTTS